MNIRIALAALLLAFTLGDARAADGIKMPDGEICVLPGPQYVHAGAMGADRYIWWWCSTRFDLFWMRYLEPADKADKIVVDQSPQAKAASTAGFTVSWPATPWNLPEYEALEQHIREQVTFDAHPPPVPRWVVAKNGKYPDRPAYAMIDGRRATKSTMRATVGDTCSCTGAVGVLLIEGSTVYCNTPLKPSVESGPKLAVCTRAPDTPPVVTPPVFTPPKPPTAAGLNKTALLTERP